MTLEEFDKCMEMADKLRKAGRELEVMADHFENAAILSNGIMCVQRDPGFPCWTHDKIKGYRNSPRQVMEEI